MKSDAPLPATQRAYTLRLTGASREESAWQEWLWKTHTAVNRGAKAFGEWLLTLRGGLEHTLADGDPEKRQDRRIMLALSWLSVESADGAPPAFLVPHVRDDAGVSRDWQTVEALRQILRARGVATEESESWVADCRASLQAAIRSDAVWVDRSRAFDAAGGQIGPSLTREEPWDLLERFFGSKDAYLAPVAAAEDDGDSDAAGADEEAKDLVQKAGQWLSNRFGTGQGADFARMAEIYARIAAWVGEAPIAGAGTQLLQHLADALATFEPESRDLTGIKRLISGPGYKSATRNLLDAIATLPSVDADTLTKLVETASEDRAKCAQKVGSKGRHPWSDRILESVEQACGFTYLDAGDGAARHTQFSVMLDHAARRLCQTHSWVKRAEAERRRFEADSRKMQQVPEHLRSWLNAFCAERSQESGAVAAYRIRKRAVTGWPQVVEAWAKAECRTDLDRIAAARSLQDDPEMDKFGDIQLFTALAADEARCVWWLDDRANPEPLLHYVAATDAEEKKLRFKVPAYRHPDPLLHPVFCDFGESRWPIAFAVHRAPSRQAEAEEAVERKRTALTRATKGSERARNEESRTAAATAPAGAQQGLAEAERESRWLQQQHALTMTVWTGSAFVPADLRWQSKRLTHDLALSQTTEESSPSSPIPVTRADRLGRAAAGVTTTAPISVMGLFDLKEWNGRLQAPRAQLRAIACVRDDATIPAEERRRRLPRMIGRIRWLVSFSARLQPQGPWTALAQRLGLRADPTYWPHAEENKKRQGQAKLVLGRLPGLRVLSVDLGHRSAAACAVWETLTREQVDEACRRAVQPLPTAESLFLHLQIGAKTTVYRRVGPDCLGSAEHPAPWARLERQFLIRLQGEDIPARLASPSEIGQVKALEAELEAFAPPDRSRRVDDLMSEAVRTVRLALQRHGQRARIAFALTTDKQLLSGGRTVPLTEPARVDLLAAVLADWNDLAFGDRWGDPWAKEQWDACIVPLLAGRALPVPQGEETGRQRRSRREEVAQGLRPIAEQVAANPALRMKAHVLWATHWRDEDQRWRRHLRWLRDWILPRRQENAAGTTIRRVGGLSLTRLATVRSLYQVLRAYHMRPEPEDLRKNVPARGDDRLARFGQGILYTLERLRENRVKQLASRLAAAGLGLGKDLTSQQAARFAPCHAIVIENLTNYRPEDKRTRRENRQLMSWSSAKVKKYLAEACQLHGLHLREVPAAYTSRQDARTGAPGIRCQDVPVREFLQQSGYWHNEILRAKARLDERVDSGSAYDRLLLDLLERWEKTPETAWGRTRALRLPRRGGEVFVSTAMEPRVADGGRIRFPFAQADLNAAANIGLRALLDPDWAGRWWYVPCVSPPPHLPLESRTRGSAVIDLGQALPTGTDRDRAESTAPPRARGRGRRRGDDQERRTVNLWRDPDSLPLVSERWQGTKEYWNRTTATVIIRILRPCCGLSSAPLPLLTADDVPF